MVICVEQCLVGKDGKHDKQDDDLSFPDPFQEVSPFLG